MPPRAPEAPHTLLNDPHISLMTTCGRAWMGGCYTEVITWALPTVMITSDFNEQVHYGCWSRTICTFTITSYKAHTLKWPIYYNYTSLTKFQDGGRGPRLKNWKHKLFLAHIKYNSLRLLSVCPKVYSNFSHVS